MEKSGGDKAFIPRVGRRDWREEIEVLASVQDAIVPKSLGKLIGECSLLISGMLAPRTWVGK